MDSVIGVPRPRTDSPEKVSGATRYAGDDVLPGLLHGWLVLSTEAHATIVSIEKEAALASPRLFDNRTFHGQLRERDPAMRETVQAAEKIYHAWKAEEEGKAA